MPRGGTARSQLATVRTTSLLVAEDITLHSTGLAITTPLRTVADLALGERTKGRIDRLLDRALLDGHATVEELWPLYLRLRRNGRRRTSRLAVALFERSGAYVPAQSELEHLGLEALAAAGLPEPVRQHPLPGPVLGQVDLAYPEARLLIELDGRTHLMSESIRHDRRRDAAAAVAGWQVLRFGWEVVRYEPSSFADTVRTVRQQRMTLLASQKSATRPSE